MTVSTVQSSAVFLGTGSITSFGFSFNNGVPFNSNTSLASYTVIYADVDGNQTTLSPSVYTLSFNAAVTGALWGLGGTLVYPTMGSPIASGTSLTLSRIFPLQQLTSISNQGDFAPQNIEAMGDIEEMQLQQIAARTAQQRGVWASGVQYNDGDIIIDGANGANTGNYYSCVIPNISSVWATDLSAGDWSLAVNVQIIAGYASSASASAATATTEAGIATTQAGNASLSAATAVSSANTASMAASSASTDSNSASASASSASTSASTATTQAGIATTQANSAVSSASAASSSATSAATSATNAANSATAAATSAVAAGSTLVATSTTSNTIGTGNFTFTTQANKNFNPGQIVIVASNANGANYIHGYVASYSGTTLIITETDLGGSGAHSDWNISASGPVGPSGGGTGTVTTVSVATTNGFSGTVSNPTTTPAITLMATPTGILKSNGTALDSALAGTDYLTPTGNGSGLTALTAANISAGTAGISISGNSGTVTTINGRLAAGTGISITGSGTSGSPYTVTSNSGVAYNSIAGCILSSITGSSTTAAISVSTGQATNSANTAYIVSAGYSWAATNGNAINGTDAASSTLGNSTTYHMFLCSGGSGTGTFVSASLTPTFPAGYTTSSRRIGSFNTNGSGAPIPYTSIETEGGSTLNYLTTQILDVSTSTLGTSRTLFALTVPNGIKVQPIIRATSQNTGQVILTSADETDVAPASSSSAAPLYDFSFALSNSENQAFLYVTTNTSRQIGARCSTAGGNLNINTRGFKDFRRS